MVLMLVVVLHYHIKRQGFPLKVQSPLHLPLLFLSSDLSDAKTVAHTANCDHVRLNLQNEG